MVAYQFPLDEYLARIKLERVAAASSTQLERLHRAHVYAVPFENLDIQLGRGINLDPRTVDEKIIRRHRGGYCFELNALFKRALEACGFEVRTLLARVHITGVPSGRSHQLSLVTINNQEWVVDVGFGSACPRAPLPFEMDSPQKQDGLRFQLTGHALGYMLQAERDGSWQDLYSFDLGAVVANDIIYGNHYMSTSPESIFTISRVVTMCHPEGETLLHNYRCTRVHGVEQTIEQWPNSPHYLRKLAQHFGIELSAKYEDLQGVDVAN
jgi:N-hydroxyarylamine O-acetyltransferase